ncbi:4-carboxy-4-hydroxy-2-oxoadipate aldolase/oxaloacetate decarboxylase [Actinospica sp.]|uniref:4-carboxy-4-hydroxy-2-oxoadipate aldolase/oxaloacetate decarboxylase n=1 Tax=Actinospica sp. TaxID=1872142 RepID=UPI002C5BEB04|nr:4-carboxy-4-hydroxy-2-oxoadipate aldolase/oxaloacetate decarboxylase [Actinospica sp.]HWG28744.1 4-carboxy-4-hydroxy-2-oxoadipate aldolase/oxaloacetate decarboxylase [Actinospica sp.]
MKNVVVTGVPRPPIEQLDKLASFGVATVHEALGRTGYLGPELRPIQRGARIAGSVVTALVWPGDNLMIHAAVEQCAPGDVLVVAPTSPCTDGYFGELLATSLAAHGVRGLVIDAGVRDTAELREMGFPVWSRHVSAQGTVKATAGAVNVPVVIGGQTVHAGSVVLADDDGVLIFPARDLPHAIEAANAREAEEQATREALAAGGLGLDRYNLRALLKNLGVEYVTYEEYHE